ncbi:MAG: saccharopine dehydrogenase family protein [Flavobacterium sp.]
MKRILLIGAGRSTSSMISYWLQKMEDHSFGLTIVDLYTELATKVVKNHPNVAILAINILEDEAQRKQLITSHDIVVSMLPAHLHLEVAKDCILFKKHLFTASYVNEGMKQLHEEAVQNGVMLLNEMGVDPGIDHMSAMQVMDKIKIQGGKMILFESFTGGLVAPESDDNLWNYKFTWNPRNVVLAGQGGVSKFIQEGKYKYIPYQKLFRRTEFLQVEGYGTFEGYANRDSLKYRSIYGLDDIATMYRGTLRRVGFSKAWDMLVQLGMTDDSYTIEDSENMSYRDFTNAFLAYHPTDSVELKLRHYLKIDQDDVLWYKLVELDLFNSNKMVGLKNATPAQILEKILSEKWKLQAQDKDMIVMYHKFGYEIDGQQKQIDATMVCLGEDQTYTAMAKTVGLPLAIAALRTLTKGWCIPGVQIPILPEIYQPILLELQEHGIIFHEKDTMYQGYNSENLVY